MISCDLVFPPFESLGKVICECIITFFVRKSAVISTHPRFYTKSSYDEGKLSDNYLLLSTAPSESLKAMNNIIRKKNRTGIEINLICNDVLYIIKSLKDELMSCS